MVGLVVGMRTMKNKRGEDMGFVTLDDRTARIEVLLFAEAFRQCREFVVLDSLVVVEGVVSVDDFSGGLRVRANEVYTLTAARERYARELLLQLDESQFSADFASVLERLLGAGAAARARPGCPVRVVYTGGGARAEISLGNGWRVPPSDEVLGRLRERFGAANVRLRYGA